MSSLKLMIKLIKLMTTDAYYEWHDSETIIMIWSAMFQSANEKEKPAEFNQYDASNEYWPSHPLNRLPLMNKSLNVMRRTDDLWRQNQTETGNNR